MKENIKVLVVEPKKQPYEKTINYTLKDMQKLVGGLIEPVHSQSDDACLIVNEEYLYNGSEANRVLYDKNNRPINIIYGTFFVCNTPEDSEEFESITDEQLEKYKKRFSIGEVISLSEDGESPLVLHDTIPNNLLMFNV